MQYSFFYLNTTTARLDFDVNARNVLRNSINRRDTKMETNLNILLYPRYNLCNRLFSIFMYYSKKAFLLKSRFIHGNLIFPRGKYHGTKVVSRT